MTRVGGVPGRPVADSVGKPGEERLPIFIDALVATGVEELVSTLDVEPVLAREVMRTVAHRVCSQFQRTTIYVPVDLAYELSQRDRDIWAAYQQDSAHARKFTPQRVGELSEQHKLTTVQIYCIVRLMRERERAERAREWAERQGVLPGFDTAQDAETSGAGASFKEPA